MSSRFIGVAVTALLASICGILPAAISVSLGLEFAGIIVVLTFAVAFSVGVDVKRGGDLCSPLGLSGLFYLLAFVGGPIFYWFNPNFGQKSPRVLPFDHPALVAATALCLLAWLGLAVGYLTRPLAVLKWPALKLGEWQNPAARTLAILYGIGWLARGARFTRGEYFHGDGPGVAAPVTGSTTGQLLLILAILPAVVVAYTGVTVARRHAKLWQLAYWLGLAVEVAYYLPSGARSSVVAVAVLAVIVAFYNNGRLPIRMLLITALLLLFVLFPLIHLYRGSGNEAGFASNAAGNLQHSAATFAGQGVQQTLLYGVGSTFSRFSDILVPAALVYKGRQVDPVPRGETLAWSVTNLIPKALWPNKPSTGTFAGELAQSIGLVASSRTSVATTQPGEFFLNFGAIGTVLAMIVVGGVYREFGEWLRERGRQPMVLALYAAVAYSIIGSHETIIAQGLTGLVRTTVVLAFILWASQYFFAPIRRRALVPSQGV